jgi:hypothetical protein
MDVFASIIDFASFSSAVVGTFLATIGGFT